MGLDGGCVEKVQLDLWFDSMIVLARVGSYEEESCRCICTPGAPDGVVVIFCVRALALVSVCVVNFSMMSPVLSQNRYPA